MRRTEMNSNDKTLESKGMIQLSETNSGVECVKKIHVSQLNEFVQVSQPSDKTERNH